jgi:hypothetical protein
MVNVVHGVESNPQYIGKWFVFWVQSNKYTKTPHKPCQGIEVNMTRDDIAQAYYTNTKAYEECLEWDGLMFSLLHLLLLLFFSLIYTNNME